MLFFGKPKQTIVKKEYDKEHEYPIIKANTCNSDQVAGFKNKETGAFREVMAIMSPEDLEVFKRTYGLVGEIKKVY